MALLAASLMSCAESENSATGVTTENTTGVEILFADSDGDSIPNYKDEDSQYFMEIEGETVIVEKEVEKEDPKKTNIDDDTKDDTKDSDTTIVDDTTDTTDSTDVEDDKEEEVPAISITTQGEAGKLILGTPGNYTVAIATELINPNDTTNAPTDMTIHIINDKAGKLGGTYTIGESTGDITSTFKIPNAKGDLALELSLLDYTTDSSLTDAEFSIYIDLY